MNEVRTERRDGGVLLVTIDRPQARNAVNTGVAEGIAAAMEELDGDAGLAVGVLTGAGGYFCAGMDLKAFAAGERPWVEGRGFAGIVERPPVKPLIAAVEGFALAGGLELALSCDLIVSARGARFGIPEVKRGLAAAGGGLLRLPARIPRAIAMELALTGDPIDAERAAAIGLVNVLAEPGSAVEEALLLAARVAPNAPLAVAASKRVVDESPGWAADELWTRQAEILDPVQGSRDALEGATAFAEKREPKWEGR